MNLQEAVQTCVQQDFTGLFVFLLCCACLFFGMIIMAMIFNRIDRVQKETAENYARKFKREIDK